MQTIFGGPPEFVRLRAERRSSFQRQSPAMASVVARDAFGPGTSALILVGDIDRGTAVALAREHINWEASTVTPTPRELPAAHETAVPVAIREMRSSQLQITYVVAAPDLGDADSLAFEVLQSAVGGAFTSSMNQRLRHELGASYGVHWGEWDEEPGRVASLETRIDARAALPATRAFVDELARIRAAPLPLEEVVAARERVYGQWEGWLGTPVGILTLTRMAFRDGLPLDEMVARANASLTLTPADLHAVAMARFAPARSALVITGNLGSLAGHRVVRTDERFAVY